MDTVPLLSPTMESELLKDPWVFPQPKASATKAEEKQPSFTWEENFQDLSGWCMDTFQGQCDFHTGESPAFKVSGTKYEGNSVLSSEEGVLKDLMSVTDEKKWSMKMNTAETAEHSTNHCHSLQSTSEATKNYENEDSIAEPIAPSNLLKLPKIARVAAVTSPWRPSNADIGTPFQSRYQTGDIVLQDAASPTSLALPVNQRETWDVLRTVETTGSDTFDLLSYLCDDEMRSPEGSVSTDSSVLSKPWSLPKLPVATIPRTRVKVKTETNDTLARDGAKERATATVTPSSAVTSVTSNRRSERTRTSVINKVVKTYSKGRLEKSGRKRYADSDSDDRTFALHYRESREKNNEASRKSRMNKKAKETEMSMMATELERDNRILKMKVEELEKLVTSMRSALLRSALKKEF